MQLSAWEERLLEGKTGLQICHTRRIYLGPLDDYHRESLARYTEGMRRHWDKYATAEKEDPAGANGPHVCGWCADIEGAPFGYEPLSASDKSEASWAPGLYAERVFKMGGEWGQDDRIEYDPRRAAAYRLADEIAEYEDEHGFIER